MFNVSGCKGTAKFPFLQYSIHGISHTIGLVSCKETCQTLLNTEFCLVYQSCPQCILHYLVSRVHPELAEDVLAVRRHRVHTRIALSGYLLRGLTLSYRHHNLTLSSRQQGRGFRLLQLANKHLQCTLADIASVVRQGL